jgi:phosphocarrier protein FPr
MKLVGHEQAPICQQSGILVARELHPMEVARLDPAEIAGICLVLGSPTSHSAIIARSLGIPLIVGLDEAVLTLPSDTRLLMDAGKGYVWIDPPPELVQEYSADLVRQLDEAPDSVDDSGPLVTAEGRTVEIAANISSPEDAAIAARYGADAIGLFRTEFLFMGRQSPPDEEEQYAVYQRVLETVNCPVTFRTLDVGGDKPLPYLHKQGEANPFLGWRGIRISLMEPDLFKTQLRAILRLSRNFQVRVMFPMVTTVDEVRQARALMAEAERELAGRGILPSRPVETGIMIETPAAALQAKRFAPEVDFFSIGTNDLSQYVFAADRGNPRVSQLAEVYHPTSLLLIRDVVQSAHDSGKRVGLCGEVAGETLALPLLLGLGIDELSMSPRQIPAIRRSAHSWMTTSARRLTDQVMNLETGEEVRSLLGHWSRKTPDAPL